FELRNPAKTFDYDRTSPEPHSRRRNRPIPATQTGHNCSHLFLTEMTRCERNQFIKKIRAKLCVLVQQHDPGDLVFEPSRETFSKSRQQPAIIRVVHVLQGDVHGRYRLGAQAVVVYQQPEAMSELRSFEKSVSQRTETSRFRNRLPVDHQNN